MNTIYQGFVLQATYRIQQNIPVVYIFGRLVDGRTFVIRDSQQVPHFYVKQSDSAHVLRAQVAPCEFSSLLGEPLSRVDVRLPGDAPNLRDSLHHLGIATYEADVRFAMRYLIDRGIKGGIAIEGKALEDQADRPSSSGVDVVFENPKTGPAPVGIDAKVLSFDIETNPGTDQLLAIACYGCGVDEVVVVDPRRREMPNKAIGVADESQALGYFVDLVARLDVDVLTGWNVIDFDLSFLSKVAKRHKFDLQLGRERGAMKIRPAQGYFGSGHASIPGRIVLDGIDLLRGAFIKMDEYSLQGVAQSVLGEGKTLGADGGDKVAQILHTYEHDLAAFTTYARTDARLVVDIIDKLNVIDLAFARSTLTGMPTDRVAASIASFDFLYLSAMYKKQLAAPSVASNAAAGAGPGTGVLFLNPKWVCTITFGYVILRACTPASYAPSILIL